MILSEYEAKRADLDTKMQELNMQESEKKMELSVKYQAECKRIQSQIGQLKKRQKDLLKEYQNDKAWWHDKFRTEKHQVTERMHMLRLEYLTVNGIDSKEARNTPPVVEKRSMRHETTNGETDTDAMRFVVPAEIPGGQRSVLQRA